MYKKTDVDRIKLVAGCKVISFEEKAIKNGERKLIIECIKEKEKVGYSKIKNEDREMFLIQNRYTRVVQ